MKDEKHQHFPCVCNESELVCVLSELATSERQEPRHGVQEHLKMHIVYNFDSATSKPTILYSPRNK